LNNKITTIETKLITPKEIESVGEEKVLSKNRINKNENGEIKSKNGNSDDKNESKKEQQTYSIFSNHKKDGEIKESFSGNLFKIQEENKQNDNNPQPSTIFGNNTLFSSSQNNLFSFNSQPGSFFNSTNNTGLFGNQSLFSNSNSQTNFFNFGNVSGNSFFKNAKKESDDEGDGEEGGEDEKQEDNSLEAFKPNKEDLNSPYLKKYNKLIETFYLFNKETKKYISKGEGYLSLEYTDKPSKVGVLVFRNKMGSKIFDGIITAKFEKIESSVRNFKYLSIISTIQKNKEKFDLAMIKLSFSREDEFKEFENSFKEIIALLK